MFSQEQLPVPVEPSKIIDQDLETRIMSIGLLNSFLVGIVFYYILRRR